MPILKGKCFPLVKPVVTVGAKDTVYVIPHTNEQFVSKEEYTKRLALYNESVWTCQCTGATKLTHREALDSEQKALKQLNSTFPVIFEKAVLELVHLSANPLDVLVDRASKRLYEMLVIGEHVTLKVTSQGTALRGVVVKMDSSSADKLNASTSSSEVVTEGGESNTDDTRKKFKLLPYKYSVKLEGQDSIINGIPANDLVRETHVPNKDLIKLFIRARAVRSGTVFCSAWIVDENYVRKHSLQKKNFPTPHKVVTSANSTSKSPKEQKDKGLLNTVKRSQSEEKPKSKPSLENKSIEKMKSKKRSLCSLKTAQKDGTPVKKAKKRLLVDTDGSTSSDLPLAKLTKKTTKVDEDDDDIVLAVLKKAVKKKSQEKGVANDMPLSELQNKKTPSSDSSDEDDVALAALKPKKLSASEKKDKTSNKTSKSSPSKIKFKQVTLYQLNCVKKIPGSSSPAKGSPHSTPNKHSGKSPQKPPKSPYQLPPLVARLQKADKEQHKGLYHQLIGRCVRDLTEAQIKSLPEDLKSILVPKFERYQEKKKLESMSEAEREAYLLKKKEENKQKVREKMKQKMADAKKRFEDTKLDLLPIPVPKLVSTPDGMANELFGDAAMVTEFIACYKGLLMPDDNTHITTDLLMQALVNGQQGFPFLSKVLVILLQTLLQDHLADDYKELSLPLSELPVNEFTASELVRLCLRHQDINDDSDSDKDDEDDKENVAFEEEVPADIIDLLETSEFHELEPNVKLQILVGFCHRIMASYSVQDYMNEKQQDAADLWKKRIAEQKLANDKKKEDKKSKKDKHQSDADVSDIKQSPASSVQQGLKQSGSTASLDEMVDDDEDLVSKLKRRRLLAAKAAEDKKKKEVEDKQLREEIRQQRELELAEKSFKDGISLAKHVLRRTSLGLDRNHDRYWLFPSAMPGLYIEKGWVTDDAANYSMTCKLSTSLSASESETEAAEAESCDAENSCARLNTTLPHTGQNLWFVLDSVDDLQKLLDNLHPQGVRESTLKVSLGKNYDSIVKSLSKTSRLSEVQAKVEEDVIIEGTRKELQDMEIRLRHGGLGGVPNFERWEKRLLSAKAVKDFTELLLETQAHVVERFVTGMMAKNGKNQQKSEKSENDDEAESVNENIEDDKLRDEKSSSMNGVQQWLDAVAQCTTFSRFNVLMGMLECCIKWEKSAENAKCKICRKKGEEDHLLLCDECNQAFHLYCLRPALSTVPKGEWYCPACSPERSTRKCRSDDRKGKWNIDAGSSDEDEEMSDEIEHEETCAVCGEEGDLAECSSCVSAFHLDCHDPPMRHIPRQNTWKCMQCKSGVRLRKSRRPATKSRKRYTYSDDEDESEDEVPVKKTKKASPVTQNNKRASDADRPMSRNRSRCSDAGVVTPTTRGKILQRDDSQSADCSSRSRRSDTSTKENRFFDENTKQAVLSIIDKLRKHRQSWPFLEPVDPVEVPDYYKVVKKPIDLRTIEDKCISDVYLKPQQFIEDFSIMMKNAEQYNEVDSPVYKCVNPYEKYFEQLVDRLLPQCTYRR